MLAIVGMLSAAKQISWFLPQNPSHTSQSQPKMTPERSTALKKKKKQDRCDILKDSNRLLTDTDPPAARTQISQNPVLNHSYRSAEVQELEILCFVAVSEL